MLRPFDSFSCPGPPKSVGLSSPSSSVSPLSVVSGVAGQSSVGILCTVIGGNPAPSLLWKLGAAWLEAESVSKEQEEGRVVSVVRLSLGRGDHGKVLQCQVHPQGDRAGGG